MKGKILLIFGIFLILIGNLFFVSAVDLGLGDLDLNGLYLAFSGWNNQVACGGFNNDWKYDPTNVLNVNLCGYNQKIGYSFGSIAQSPGGSWSCTTNNICNNKNYIQEGIIYINHTGRLGNGFCSSLQDYPICNGDFFVLPMTQITTGYVGKFCSVLCVKKEYFEYFKDEIQLVNSDYGCWNENIFETDPPCREGYNLPSNNARNFVGDNAGCSAGKVIRAAICVRGNGIINLDYNETKCKKIYGNNAWNSNAPSGKSCCGDDGFDLGYNTNSFECIYSNGKYSWENCMRCIPGNTECIASNQNLYKECKQYGNGCTAWYTSSCAFGETCQNGQCQLVTAGQCSQYSNLWKKFERNETGGHDACSVSNFYGCILDIKPHQNTPNKLFDHYCSGGNTIPIYRTMNINMKINLGGNLRENLEID